MGNLIFYVIISYNFRLKKASSTIDLLGSGLSPIESNHSNASSAPSVADPWDASVDIKPRLNKRSHNGSTISLQQLPVIYFYITKKLRNKFFHALNNN